MTLDPQSIARRLGAKHVGEAPARGDGAFGMAELACFLKDRLDPRGRPQGAAVAWILGTKIHLPAETEKLLIELAEKLSTPEHRVSPVELAARLLEESIQKMAREQKSE